MFRKAGYYFVHNLLYLFCLFFSLAESLFCSLPVRRLTCANSGENLAADHEQSLKMWEGG